jgi:hypothetical protein
MAPHFAGRYRHGVGELDELMETLLPFFYLDNTNLAARDSTLLQRAIDDLVTNFKREDLETNTNTKKTHAMPCTPGKIRLQLPADSYQWMHSGCTPAANWDAHMVTCRECGK